MSKDHGATSIIQSLPPLPLKVEQKKTITWSLAAIRLIGIFLFGNSFINGSISAANWLKQKFCF